MGRHQPGAGQYCPISRALDVLGERWTLLIVRDMLVGATRFNDIARGLPGLSRTLLATRLRHLERAGIIERSDTGYGLTQSGRALEPLVFGMAEWGARWVFGEPEEHELDAELLVWWMHTRLDTSLLRSEGPSGERQVVHVRFADEPKRFWIVVDRGVPSVCTADPGYEVDLTIRSDVRSLYEVWLGRLPIATAMRRGVLAVDGPPGVSQRLGEVLRLSPVAGAVMNA
ncbi:winged helix-turn-helix transcriptional regulator [Intrasporangium sp. DVR]|uniref:winged helix-turn-helix transcriptional regulator n=1 Tax=Intrasporangium sp. DVR TaxID=3127867 RepID=UPI00313A6015